MRPRINCNWMLYVLIQKNGFIYNVVNYHRKRFTLQKKFCLWLGFGFSRGSRVILQISLLSLWIYGDPLLIIMGSKLSQLKYSVNPINKNIVHLGVCAAPRNCSLFQLME